jgi:20S proteasome alpha/beta subunit
MRELNKEFELEYLRIIRKKKLLEEIVGKSTLIIGARGTAGIVVGSDKKVIRGGESDYEEKLETLNIGTEESPIEIGFGASGFVGIKEDFIRLFVQTLKENIERGVIKTLLDIKFIAEDMILNFENRYVPRLQTPVILEFLVCGLSKLSTGEAELYVISGGGYGEKIKYCQMIGHGSPYARTVNQYLFDRHFVNSLSLEEIAKRMAICFYWISEEVDSYVGGEPTFFIMKDNNPKLEKIEIDKRQMKELVSRYKEKLRNISSINY